MEIATKTTSQAPAREWKLASHRRPGDALRILHVVRTLSAGGLEVGVVNLVRVLQEAGFEQGVCCLEEKGPLAEKIPGDVPVWSCRPKNPSRFNRHELRAVSLFRKFRPDVIHARNFGAWIDSAFARTLALNPGKLAFTTHGWDRIAHMSRRKAFVCRILSAMTTGMAAVSPQTATEFGKETGIPASRFEILHSGVDTNRFAPNPDRLRRAPDASFVIACVARLDPVKRHETLIDAVSLMRSQHNVNVELRLVGDGPMRATLEDQVRRLGIERSVLFLGTRDDAPEQLRDADVFALASVREGRPTSIMEAMSAGLPVVATNVGSVADLVDDGESGFVIEPDNPEILAKTLLSLVQHDELRRKMSEAARAKALREFSLERMARDYAEFYRGIVAGKLGKRSSSVVSST